MIQGTTPTLRFNLPIGTYAIKNAEIVVEYVDENKRVQFIKGIDDCTIGENHIEAMLTQEETLQLPTSTVGIQLRVLMNDGTVLATEVQKVSVKRLLKKDVIE